MTKYYCPECRNPATSGTVQCTKCSQWWHPKCARITLGAREKLQVWLCLNCDFPTSPSFTSGMKIPCKVTPQACPRPRSFGKNTPIVTPRNSNPKTKTVTRPSSEDKTPCTNCSEYVNEVSALTNRCSVLENQLSAIQNELLPLRNAHESLQSDLRNLQNLTDEKTTTIDTLMMQLNQLGILSPMPPVKLRSSPFSSEMNNSIQGPSNQICNSLSDVKSACSVRMILDNEIQESVKLADVRLTDENNFRNIQPTEDEPLIVFEKIVQQKVKRKPLTSKGCNIICRFFVKEAPKFNKICRYFNENGFCKHRKKCRFLHICPRFISKTCSNNECNFDHVDLCCVLSCTEKECVFAHACCGTSKRRSSSHTNRQENTFLDPNPASKNLIGRGLRIQKHRDYTFCGPPWPPLPTIPPVHQHTPNQACVAPSRSVGMFFPDPLPQQHQLFYPPQKITSPSPPTVFQIPVPPPSCPPSQPPMARTQFLSFQPKFQY